MDIARLSDDAARWYIAQIDNILKLFFMYFTFLHWDYVLSVVVFIFCNKTLIRKNQTVPGKGNL